jgi:3-oxoacyl-[acyl-carrier-protein] synthase II
MAEKGKSREHHPNPPSLDAHSLDGARLLAEFHGTMREFLAAQERVILAHLNRRNPLTGAPSASNDHNRTALITGIGMVTPLGIGWQDTWSGLCSGTPGIHAARRFDPTGLATRFAGEVPDGFEALYRQRCRLPFPERYARFTQFAMLSGLLAVEDAGLELEREDRSRLGIAFGVGAGCFNYLLDVDQRLRDTGQGLWPALDHNYVIKHMTNAPSSQLSIWSGARGPSTTVSVACSTGAQAIATALEWIRTGKADIVLAGASDATVNPFVIHAYNQIHALSTRNESPERASRPFDRRRDGFAMAEGGTVLVIESVDHARRRGAKAYAQILGYASTSEAYNVVTPRPLGEGMAETMRLALRDARVHPEQAGYISAHGTATPLNDLNETAAIKSVFGQHAGRLAVSASKSMLGHAIGASSAIQVGIVALSLHHGVVTPTINYEEPDPECDLDYVPNEARTLSFNIAVSNAFAFGGHNCSIVLCR